MIVVTLASLVLFLQRWMNTIANKLPFDPNGPLSSILLGLAVLLVIESSWIVGRSLWLRRASG
jgi:hypothetical protein